MTQETLAVDVVIVGGGPAGSAAAIELCRAGRSVVVIDKATFPRDKCCGDGLTTLALRELDDLGFDPGGVIDWFDVPSAALRSPSGRQVTIPLPEEGRYAAVAPRLQLDNALLDLARSAGADVRDGHAFRSLDSSNARNIDGHLAVEADDLHIHTRYVIAADGMWSPVRKATGQNVGGYIGEWNGFRQYASNVTGTAASQLHVWFEPDLLPGYAWSFPLPGNRANIGFGVLRDGSWTGKNTKAVWPDLLQRPHIVEALGPDFEMEGRHTGQALLTGRLAAESIITGGATQPDVVSSTYEREVRHHLVADHKMSLALGKVLAKGWGARGAIRVVGSSGEWGKRNFARWMFEDEPRALVLTPSRWHRRFLKQPGAYRHPVSDTVCKKSGV